ncbi:MAG: helix-turn-helix transcriptional regulator [Oligoflexia bacterium]|nr:helix-turn-helix transcriptional regulator [Oligoflexia bacterium]
MGDTLVTIGIRIEKLRQSKGLTRVQLANALGTRYYVIRALEYGRPSRYSLELLPRLSAYFGVEIGQLVGCDPPSTPTDTLSLATKIKELSTELVSKLE